MTDAPVSKNTATNAALSTNTPEKYEALNGQEAHAAQVAQANQTTQASLEKYDAALSGNEQTANQIVTSIRDTQLQTNKQVADGSFDLNDNRGGAAALNNTVTASGRELGAQNYTNMPINNVGNVANAAKIEVVKPAAGHTSVVAVHPGDTLTTTFDPNKADLSMHGKDLEMKFADGSKIVLQGFATDLQHLPNVALANGLVVAGGVIIAQLQGTNENIFNLETAAGPAGGGEGGGQFSYSDDLGNVIGLLNKLPPIPFTALEFTQPQPNVTISDTETVGGTFTHVFETVDGRGNLVAGGFEDWQAAQNVGDYTQTPMALNITFTPDDNEVVDTIVISNIPNGVLFFYGQTNAYVPVVITNGSVTFTAAQLAAGNIFVLPTANNDADIPMTITLNIHDPDTNQLGVLSQTAVAVIDAVADLPSVSTSLTVNGVTMISPATGAEESMIGINANVTFPDNDGSEVHTIVLSGVPHDWTLVSSPGLTFTSVTEANGTDTYTVTVTANVNSTITFDPHEWTDAAGANLLLTVTTAESVTDGELTLANNTAEVQVPFTVTLIEDVPQLVRAESDSMFEHNLSAETATGVITANFFSDGPGAITLTTNNLSALGLTSHGETISYAVTTNNQTHVQTLTATDSGGAVVFTLVLNAPTAAGTEQTAAYTFTLFQELDHAAGAGNNNIVIPFQFFAADTDGDTLTSSFNITIIDDVPVAHSDIGNIPDGSSVATGNVITNDTLSVDVVNVLQSASFGGVIKAFATPDGTDAGGKFVLLNGAYGQLKIYENGAYTYTYDNAHNTGNHTETFNYSLIDFDSDTSATTLIINITDNGPGQPPSIVRTIDETTDINSVFNGTITVANATIFTLGDHGATAFTSGGSQLGGALTSHGVPVTVSLVGGQYVGMAGAVQVFTLSINNSGQYSFVLKAPIDQALGTDPNDIINLNFHYTASDADGDSVVGTIQVNVRDDAPVAFADTNTVADNTTTATGNVITNDTLSKDVGNFLKDVSFGGVTKSFATPDGSDVGGRFVLVNGTYGQIKIYENGAYTYTYDAAHNVGNHTEVFNYTLIDFDGDISVAPLTINIVDNGPGRAPDISRTIDETTDINSVFSGTITVAGATIFSMGTPAGASDFSSTGSQLGGNLTSHGVPVTVSLVGGQYVGMAGAVQVFTMSITAGGQYSFVLKAPIDQADGSNPNDTINLNFTYTAQDNDGDAVSGHIQVVVRDDAPVAIANVANIPDGGSVATGNVMTNDVLSKDVTNFLKDVSFGAVTKSFATPDGSDAGGKYVLVNGAYGQVKIYETGEFTYTYDNAHNTGNHTEVFNYTLVDYDRDTSATTLTINIVDKGPGQAPDVTRTIDETTDINLTVSNTIAVTGATMFALGTPAGASEFTSTGSLLGGNLTSNGVPITVSLVGGQYVGMAGAVQVFTLSINNSGQYSFVLKAPIDHANGADPNDMINLNFTYTAKDADGDSTSGHIQIVVKDDAPLAASDINSVADNTTTAVGNVMTNDTMSKDVVNLLKDVSFGAVTKSFATPDGTDGGGRFVLVNGAYGQIKIYENGNYTYTYDAAHNSGNHSEVFNYTLKDRDGDTSTTTLTINIVDNGPGVAPDISRTIDETTDINSVFSGTITVANATVFALGTPAGASDFSSTGSQLGGNLTSHGVPVTVSLVGGQYVGMAGAVQVFTMSITAGGQYSFVLKAPIDQADGTNPNDTINLNFTYTAKDADGDAVSGHIQVVVRDDAPVTVADIGNIPDGGSVATGNVMNNDVLSKDVTNLLQSASFGGVTKSFATPDGTDGGGRFVLVNGAYGQLKIYENGNYTYTYDNAHNSGNHSEVFNYTLVDYDRDTSATTLTINIVDKGPGTAPDISRTIDETTDINSIFSGTITVANATAFALGTPAGASGFTSTGSMLGGALTSHGVPVTVTLVGGQYVGKAGTLEVFTLSITAGGQYSFVLKAPIDQADGSNPNDVINLNFNYTARDADGDAVSGHIQVAVRDDAPVAVADVGTIPNGSSVATGNVITNDVLSKDVTNVLKDASFGGVTKSFATPDGTDAGGRFVLVNGAYGQLKIYENGNYTYTYDNAHNTGNHSEVFNYTLKDFDGDTSTTTLTLSITDGCPVAVNVTNTLDETTDINASISSTISVATATAFALGTVTGASAFGSTGSLLGGNLTSHGVPITVTLVGGQYVGKAGAVEVFTLSINNSGQYNFVLKAPIDHALGTDPNDMINLNFAYTARDSDGDASEGQIRIIVKDDAPIAHADVNIFADSAVTNGNVITGLNGGTGAADTLSKDVSNVMKDVSFGAVTKSFATPDGTDAGGAYVSINGAHGTLKIYADGNYTYTLSGGTPLPGNGGSTGDTFNYTIKDYDGDSSSTTLTLQTMLPKLIVGENVNDNTGQTTPYHVGTGTGVITGDTASDLLVGDVGGSALQNVDKDYNVVLILDTSSSMSGNKIALLKQAVVNLLGDLHNYAGGDVKVHIVPFNNSTEPVATFMVTANGDYNSAINFVNALTIDSHTNYEAPLQSAISWLQGNTSNDPIPGAQTFTYFVSDGAPNYYMNGNTPTSGSASLVMDQITGSDGTNEVAILQGFGEVIGVGIGVDSTTLGRLSVIDSGTDSAIDVQDPNDLSAALQAANPLNQLSGVGHDVLTGGDGNDLIFGDALNTDALAQAQHLTTSPGAGWMVFAELEANHGWSRADTINYIRTHVEELGHETLNSQGQSRTGGNDTITGGNGNDIIFGQEGNDAINGGAGNDILSGGTGNNTLTGGAGADTFLFLHNGAAGHDTITDYSLAQGDKLDISDLLVGSGYTPGISSVDNFVKIDHVTGQVFVDSTGAGHFDNTNVVATLNGISGIDTLNVVLSDSEGTRTVHTV